MILEIKSDYNNKCGNCKYFKTEDKITGYCENLEAKIKPWNRNRYYNSKACIRKEKLKEEFIKMEEINLVERLKELSEYTSIEELQNALNILKDKKVNRKNQYKEGMIVAYMPKDSEGNIYKVEIGKIKRLCNDGAFVWYHTGDTAAKTDYKDLYKIDNEYAILNLGGQNE